MPNKAYFAAALSLALCAASGAFSQDSPAAGSSPVARLLPPEAAARLATSGKAVRSSSGSPGYLPDHPASAGIRDALAKEKPSLLVEAVFALPRAMPSGAAARSAELSSIYGILRALGSLQGIEYYSVSHKAMRTLYAESYIIDGPSSKTRLEDPEPPAPGAVPVTETLFAFQRDLSFGANTYRYDFAAYPDAILVKSGNLTSMSYGIVPLIAPNALATRLLVIQADDAILFYVESGTNAPGLFRGRLEESFANRAEALFKWFSAKAASNRR
jgi:hypothetical protein